MMYRTGAFAGLVALLALCQTAAANPAGTWNCQLSNQPQTQSPYDTWTYQFQLQLSPDGQGYAQGTYWAMSAGYNEPFQAQGQWQQSSDGVGLQFQGNVMKQSGSVPMLLILRYVDNRNMSFRGSTAMGTLVQACQR
jgi:hypothetical protein